MRKLNERPQYVAKDATLKQAAGILAAALDPDVTAQVVAQLREWTAHWEPESKMPAWRAERRRDTGRRLAYLLAQEVQK